MTGAALAPAEVVAVFGRRGTGKTSLARRLVAPWRRAVAFDPEAEWCRFPGWRGVGTLGELRRVLRSRWGSAFRVALVPAAAGADLRAELHELARLLWLAQDPAHHPPPVALIVDEMSLGYPVRPLPRELWGMPRVTLQGRHRQLAVVGISQRPALVSADFRSSAHRTLLLQLGAADQRAVLQLMGREHGDQLRQLRPFEFIEDSGAGGVRRGRVPRPGRLPALPGTHNSRPRVPE